MSRVAILLAAVAGCASMPAGADEIVDDDGKADGGSARTIPWSVSRHVFPGEPRARITGDLELIAELGAKYVRTDLWWFSIEPQPGHYDTAALDHYRWYVEEADRLGLGVVVIVSNAPGWAHDLYKAGKRDELAAAFGRYSERVAETVGDLVTYYQLWNEPNHVIDFPDGEMDVKLFGAGRAGLERGRATIGATRPMRTIINVLVDGHDGPLGRWEDDVRFYLARAGASVDVISIDHYPGTWSFGDWGGNILDRLFALGHEQHKAVAIFEAGYSTSHCSLPFNTLDGQARWVREQVPRIRAKVKNPEVTRGVRFELANWFKLDDRDSSDCFDPEDNFGLVRTDRSKKPAFTVLADEIAKY
jgi:polysaccharide biosynthesis protein PslG